MSDLSRLAADLRTAATNIDRQLRPAVIRGALDIRDQADDSIRRTGHRSADFAANSLTVDIVSDTEAVISFSDAAGPLAAALEYGGAATAPGGHLTAALATEADDFARVVGAIGRRP